MGPGFGIQTLSWENRKARLITKAEARVLEQVLLRIIPLIGADKVIDQFIE